MNRYKLVSGPDNITWCSLEPLLQDLNEQYDNATVEYTKQQLYAVKTFIEALIVEKRVEEIGKAAPIGVTVQ